MRPARALAWQARPHPADLAKASLAFGVLGFITLGLTGVLGLILGIAALFKTRHHPVSLFRRRGLAVFGICLSLLSFLEPVLILRLERGRRVARQTVCKSNLAALGTVLLLYVKEHDAQFPPAQEWCKAILSWNYLHFEKNPPCPELEMKKGLPFAFNDSLSGRRLTDLPRPERTVLLFESVGGENDAGGPERLPVRPRHPDGYNIIFTDGHVETVPKWRIPFLVWKP